MGVKCHIYIQQVEFILSFDYFTVFLIAVTLEVVMMPTEGNPSQLKDLKKKSINVK